MNKWTARPIQVDHEVRPNKLKQIDSVKGKKALARSSALQGSSTSAVREDISQLSTQKAGRANVQQKPVFKLSCDEGSVQEEEGLPRLVANRLSRPSMDDHHGGEGDGQKVRNAIFGDGLVHWDGTGDLESFNSSARSEDAGVAASNRNTLAGEGSSMGVGIVDVDRMDLEGGGEVANDF